MRRVAGTVLIGASLFLLVRDAATGRCRTFRRFPTVAQLNEDLLDAIHDGDVAVARTCLVRGADPSGRRGGCAPLDAAVGSRAAATAYGTPQGPAYGRHGHRIENEFGEWAEDERWKPEHADIARLLIEWGADVRAARGSARKLLHWAAMADRGDIARPLLDAGLGVGTRDQKGRTPLHIAARAGRKEVTELLIDRGADVNAKDEWGRTPLDYAVLWHCAQIERFCSESDMGKHGEDFRESVKKQEEERLRELETVIESLKARGGKMGLHAAVASGREGVVQELLEAGAYVDAWSRHCRTPLHEAAQRGRAHIVALLIKHGAYVNPTDLYGRTPLDWAEYAGQTEAAELLRAHGAESGTPLIAAAAANDLSRMRAPIGKGESLSVIDMWGRTALYVASACGHKDAVELLVRGGADVDAMIRSPVRTPLHAASEAGHKDVAELLIRMGAHVNKGPSFGPMPLDVAKDEAMAALLRKHGGKTSKEIHSKDIHGGEELRLRRGVHSRP